MSVKFLLIIIGILVSPIVLPYLFLDLMPIDIASYAYLYLLLMSSLSLIFSLFLVATWSGERRLFMFCIMLTVLLSILGLHTSFSGGVNVSSYENTFLDFLEKYVESEIANLSFLSLYLPLLTFGIWKTGKEIAFLKFKDFIIGILFLLILVLTVVVANLNSEMGLLIRENFNVMCSLDILLVFIYLLLIRIYRETEAKAYYLTVFVFFFLNFLCDVAIVGGITFGGLPVIFYAMSHASLLTGTVYLYTRDIKVLTYREVVEEKERITELYKDVSELREILSVINRMLRHDVKNKLQIILGYIEIYLSERDESYLEKAIRAVEETNQYINRIRDLERAVSIEKGVLKPMNIRKVVEDVLSFYQVQANVQGNCYALADEAIYSAIDNIVNNAIKHGKTDKIDVKLTELENECEIRIIDYGVGVPSEIKRKIFEESFTLDPQSGSGLGLYVVRKVVERYGGRVWVEDTKPKGATFVLRLKTKFSKIGD